MYTYRCTISICRDFRQPAGSVISWIVHISSRNYRKPDIGYFRKELDVINLNCGNYCRSYDTRFNFCCCSLSSRHVYNMRCMSGRVC